MRILISFLLVCMPILAGSVDVSSVQCNGVSSQGTDSAFCGDLLTSGALAEVVPGFYVRATAWAGVAGDESWATASFTEDYVLNV